MMGDMDKRATRVLACIGPHADDSEFLMGILESRKAFLSRLNIRTSTWHLDDFSVPSTGVFMTYVPIVSGLDADSRCIIHDIKMPLLLLTPASSPLVDIDDQKRLAKAAEKSKMVIVTSHRDEIYIDQADFVRQRSRTSSERCTVSGKEGDSKGRER